MGLSCRNSWGPRWVLKPCSMCCWHCLRTRGRWLLRCYADVPFHGNALSCYRLPTHTFVCLMRSHNKEWLWQCDCRLEISIGVSRSIVALQIEVWIFLMVLTAAGELAGPAVNAHVHVLHHTRRHLQQCTGTADDGHDPFQELSTIQVFWHAAGAMQ